MFDVKQRQKILIELDIESFKKIMLSQIGKVPDTDQICLAAMHKARCYMKVDVINEQDKMKSIQWLKENGFDIPKDIET